MIVAGVKLNVQTKIERSYREIRDGIVPLQEQGIQQRKKVIEDFGTNQGNVPKSSHFFFSKKK